jgi:hypothetical protein
MRKAVPEATPPTQHTTSSPPAHGHHHHHTGQANESLVPFTTQIRCAIKAEIQRQASGADVSASAAGAALLEKAIQGSLMKENAAELRPIIQDQIHKDIQRFSNRTANLALEAFFSAEQSRILNIYTLRLLLGSDIDILPQMIKDSEEQARLNMKRYAYTPEPEGAEDMEPHKEVAN